jgi:hypothetical protein
VERVVQLEDQWHIEENVQVMRPALLAIPAEKTDASGAVTQIENPEEHLVFYKIAGEHFQTDVDIVNQFGQQTLSTYQETQLLAVPSDKISFEPEPQPEPEPLALDHFKCYWTDNEVFLGEDVYLEDQFGTVQATVTSAWHFCNPVEKLHDGVLTPISNSNNHLTIYNLISEEWPRGLRTWSVEIDNQFGTQQLTVRGPFELAVPTQKVEPGNHGLPVGLDHFLLYEVMESQYLHTVVDLNDQFGNEHVEMFEPVYFANPVQKTDAAGMVTEIQHPDEHLVFYGIVGLLDPPQVQVINQFGEQTLDLYRAEFLAVPSEKTSFELVEPEVLDHFKCYWIENEVYLGDYVYLEDQFGALEAEVGWAYHFCNPVEKTYDGEVTEIKNPNDHLTTYDLYYEEDPHMWSVEVDNQFGTQQLTVWGPTGIAVPTQKLEPGDHEPPVGLDHFLLYDVIEGPDVNAYVGLDDQFGDQPEVYVYDPIIFANPVRKTHGDEVTEIVNADEHLVFYWIDGDEVNYPNVQVVNQFGEQTFTMYYPDFLAVPSDKISFEPREPEPIALDHFKCYWSAYWEGAFLQPQPLDLYLEDQFGAVRAELGEPWYFCNPVEKEHDGVLTPILDSDHHLTVYEIHSQQEPQTWQVWVDNQFGAQQLTVHGPLALAVPTQKLEPLYHASPVGLDHFLLYEVLPTDPPNVAVGLNDEFSYEPAVTVSTPLWFANPVMKVVNHDIITPIENPEAHLVFYQLSGQIYSYPDIHAVDQLWDLHLRGVEGPWFLAVPSAKLSAEELPPEQ